MKTYEQRVSEIKTVDDIDDQLRKAKQYTMKLRKEAKSDKLNLSQKLALQSKVQEAERILRKLRMASFDIEDEINAREAAEAIV
tara:strand:+ start:2161 stop:2412 length:252 start_codon:yes stop_codon:yes gene_type:complete